MENSYIKKILNQTQGGLVRIETASKGYWVFLVKLHAQIENKNIADIDCPILKIPNYSNFVELVNKYISVAENFYVADKSYFDLTSEGFKEKLFLDLLVNCTNYDLNNIENYIQKRTQMLSTKMSYFYEDIAEIAGCKVCCSVTKLTSNLEGPYRFQTSLFKDGENFLMPEVCFGVDSENCNIYAVQNKNTAEKTALGKKLDRYFRKVNKGVDSEDFISNISPKSLISLSIFCSYLESLGIKNVKVPTYFPIRRNSFYEQHLRKVEEGNSEQLQFLDECSDNISYNTTNRLAYLFFRYQHHFEKTKCDFNELNDCVEMKIDTSVCDNENIISIIGKMFIKEKSKIDDNAEMEM